MLFLLPLMSWGQSALEIVTKSDDKLKGKSARVETTITIVRPNYTREMTMVSWSLGRDYSMTYLISPKRDAGSTFLNRQKEVWSYTPSIERIIKLPPSMMTQNWMGTDFTNDDLVKQSSMITDYKHHLIGKETIEGYSCHKIEMIPKEDAAVVWGKVVVWIDEKEYMQMKVEYYDEDGYLINTLLGKNPKMFDGKMLPSVMEMIPADKPGNKTIMTQNSMKFDIVIDESFFTTRKMKTVTAND
ncbi:outer membrane lipoprotein-sorting protein [bacterium SCSIO 12643]|nr:outer membrane lipoprotein-sorting protein [bacterium SCSIO 12643]